MQASNIKMDVAEDDKGYSVRAELPGFKKEDIHVQVDGNQVTISAETESKKEEKKDKNLICCERYEGKMFRSFVLDSDIDEANAEAEFVDGVLALTLPKKVGGDSSRQLTVK
jgi:HSP20 family protein